MLLAGAVLVLFTRTVAFPFVSGDDFLLILQNPRIFGLHWHTLISAFTTFDPELYIPVTLVSYQVNHVIAELSPWIYHVTNVLLHLINVLLVYAVLHVWKENRSIALAGALVFAVHPLTVETVAWAAARKDILSATFFLASAWFAIGRWPDAPGKRFWASMGCFLLGLLSKVSIAPLPLLLVLLLRERGVPLRRGIVAVLPFFLLAAIFVAVAIVGKEHNIVSLEPLSYGLIALRNVALTLRHVVFPVGLSTIYEQSMPVDVWRDGIVWSGIVTAAIAGAFVLAFAAGKRWSGTCAAIGWFLLLLAPSFFVIMKNGNVFITSDRYAYLPLLGMIVLAAEGLHVLLARMGSSPSAYRIVWGVVLLPLAVLCWLQVSVWSTNASLLMNIVTLDPTVAEAWNNLGSEQMDAGDLAKAEELFVEALQQDPRLTIASMNMALLRRRQGREADAVRFLRDAAAAIRATGPRTTEDVIPFALLAETEAGLGHLPAAEALLKEAVDLGTRSPDAPTNYGLFLVGQNRPDEAVAQFRDAIAITPYAHIARYELARILAANGDLEEALQQLDLVLRDQPNFQDAVQNREIILRTLRSAGR